MSKYSLENLITVKRYVEEAMLFDELIIREVDISYVPFDILKTIFTAEEDDQELYFGYEIDEKKSLALNKHLKEPIIYDFSKYSYFLGSYGIYKDVDED